MSRARFQDQEDWQTAVASETGSGCLPFYALPPIAALVIVVVWVYYAAMIFILGGEVAQVYELRRVRKLQREAFED